MNFRESIRLGCWVNMPAAAPNMLSGVPWESLGCAGEAPVGMVGRSIFTCAGTVVPVPPRPHP
jgi:hypothetical protein